MGRSSTMTPRDTGVPRARSQSPRSPTRRTERCGTGRPPGAREQTHSATGLGDRPHIRLSPSLRHLLPPRASGRSRGIPTHDAFCLWCLGCPEQASRRSEEALALARELDHPVSLVELLRSVGGMLSEMRRDAQALKRSAEQMRQSDGQDGRAPLQSRAEPHLWRVAARARRQIDAEASLHQAESCSQHAIEVARRQRAKPQELRSTTSPDLKPSPVASPPSA